MPNLIADRALFVAAIRRSLNVRRLMYQSLIFPGLLRDETCGLGAALDPENVQGSSDSLVDGMGGDAELRGYLLGGQVIVDQAQAVELASRKLGQALRDVIAVRGMVISSRGIRHPSSSQFPVWPDHIAESVESLVNSEDSANFKW